MKVEWRLESMHHGRKQDARAVRCGKRPTRPCEFARAVFCPCCTVDADLPLTVMEFFSSIGGADPLRPSLFELIAQEQLRDLLQPALKYVLSVSAGSGSTWATPVLKLAFSALCSLISYDVQPPFVMNRVRPKGGRRHNPECIYPQKPLTKVD